MSTDFIYYILITYLAGMLRLISCLLLLLVGLGVNAQTVWNNTYVADRPVMLFGSVMAIDSFYISTGEAYGTINGVSKSLVCKINTQGTLAQYRIDVDTISKQYISFSNTLIKNTRGNFVFTGKVEDTVSKLFMCEFNQALDSLSIYQYYTPNSYGYNGADIIELDGYYYVAGIWTAMPPVYNSDISLTKIDAAGNRVWHKVYNSYKRDEAESVVLLSNGHLMLGGCRNNLNNTNERANTWLLEVDTAGQVVRQWFDPNDSTYAAEGLLQTADGGFIYGAQKKQEQTIGDVYKTATVVKMNSNFAKQWVFNDGSYSQQTGIYDIEELSDGSFICCGSKPFYNGDLSMMSGWIVKLSSNGAVIWNRTYAGLKTSFSYNYLKDIDILSDGSLIAAGYSQNTHQSPPQVGWLLKLDADGCEIENCLLGLGPQTPEGGLNSQIQVWPNPFSSDVSIALTGSHISNVTFTITNTTGQVVYQQQETNLAAGYTKMLDLSYLPNGVYFVEVSSAAGKAVQRLVKE